MYAYEREKIRKEQDELLKNSYSPNTIYIDNTSEKNDKRFVSMMSSMSHTYGNVYLILCQKIYSKLFM